MGPQGTKNKRYYHSCEKVDDRNVSYMSDKGFVSRLYKELKN